MNFSRPFRRSLSALLACLALLGALASAPSPARARRTAGSLPAGVEAFVEQLRALTRKRDTAALAALARPGTSPRAFAFLYHESRGKNSGWDVAPLLLPAASGEGPEGTPPSPLVVFHGFHTLQSIGDQIFRLEPVPGDAAGPQWRLGELIPETETLGYRVRDHRLTVRIDPPAQSVAVTDAVTIERVPEGAPETAGPGLLRLSSDMRVESVTLDGKTFPAVTAPGVIAFSPPPTRTFTLTLRYQGRVDHPGSDYINRREAVLLSYWHPHIARLPAKHGVTVTVPRGWTAIGAGNLQERHDGAETSTFTYRNELPTSFFSLDAGPYQVTERTVDGRRLACYQLDPDARRARAGLDRLARSMRFFEANFGPYPYKEYALVETRGPFGGALEGYSFATFGPGTNPEAVVHELAHTWWGGIVPNPYTRSMWNESFAEWSDALFQRLGARSPGAREAEPGGHRGTPGAASAPRRGPGSTPRALRGMHSGPDRNRTLLPVVSVPLREAFDTEDMHHAAGGYMKGAHVLAMLEDILGTPLMLRCVRTFLQDHPAGEAADWDDFIAAVRKTTGKDYGWFFSQWLDRPGMPVLKLANVRVRRDGERPVVEAEVVQEGEPYRLSLPVTLETREGPGGGRPPGPAVHATVELTGPVTRLRLPLRGTPRRLSLDPDGNLLLAGAELPDGSDPLVYTFRRERR